MPRFPRNYLDTNFFHIMSQGIDKSYIFENPIDIKVYIRNMYEIKEKYNIKIIAYCIMNNHTHMLLQADKIENLSKYMQSLNTRYGHYYNKKYERVGYVFRDRYKAQGIYNEEQLNICIKYIFDNPVKAGICKKPDEYKFSNYNKNIIKQNSVKEDFVFIDIEDDKKEICKKVIKLFLNKKGIVKENIKEDKVQLKELVTMLKEEYNISFTLMSDEVNVDRKKLSRLYNK